MARWVLVSFAGWVAGFFLAILFILVVDSLGVIHTQSPLALGMGTGVGIAQARLLTSFIGKRSDWIAVTALGLAARFLVADIAQLLNRPVPYNLAASPSAAWSWRSHNGRCCAGWPRTRRGGW